MFQRLKRHAVQLRRAAGHIRDDVARRVGAGRASHRFYARTSRVSRRAELTLARICMSPKHRNNIAPIRYKKRGAIHLGASPPRVVRQRDRHP